MGEVQEFVAVALDGAVARAELLSQLADIDPTCIHLGPPEQSWSLFAEVCTRGHVAVARWVAKEAVRRGRVAHLLLPGDSGRIMAGVGMDGHMAMAQFVLRELPVIADVYLDPNAVDPEGWSALFAASRYDRVEMVRLLTSTMVNADPMVGPAGASAVWVAAQNGHVEVLRLLAAVPAADLNQPDEAGLTPFFVACLRGHTQVVRFLALEAGVNTYEPTPTGIPPLYAACQNGHTDTVQFMVGTLGVDPATANCLDGCTPLFAAARSPNGADCVRFLLTIPSCAATISTLCSHDPCSALYVAAQEGNLETVDLLLAADGVVPDQRCLRDATPLYVASQLGRLAVVQRLLALAGTHVDPNVLTADGFTPLAIAAKNGHLDVMRELVDVGGADPNLGSALWRAAAHGATAAVRLLVGLPGVDVNARHGADATTPLIAAAWMGRMGALQLLAETPGVDCSARASDGTPAISFACEQGHVDVVAWMLTDRDRWDPVEANERGATPFLSACITGQTAVVRLLCDEGLAPPDRRLQADAVHAAQRNSHEETAQYLLRVFQ